MKRIFDIIFSLVMLPFVFLICLIIGPLIYLEDKGNIFYKAKRRGVNGKIFEMYKLRSMRMNAPDMRNADNSTYNSPDDPRITKIGKVIRKISVDELPQVFNILKGDMSFIGPRPITINRPLSEYDEKRRIRLTVRPGISGYSQAYFRNSIDQEKKLQYDAEYAKNVTFWGDIKIVFKTIEMVLFRKNIYIEQENVSDVHEVK
ncbi:sugar transferase [Lacrimispora sp. 210928-DFI.3.58]|uniref:sugar transferase n=1 Tax=Lacrimispora sp. 210928-DFI.3.58 TaxID=2883214 RepID=UPI001D07127C|nr:sugar transferase [Lacrimispora sp. 210928-DFI.3.58]